MPPPEGSLLGGDRLRNYLDGMISRLGEPTEVRVGFLEDAKYPDGTSIAYIAAVNEFGGSWQMPARDVMIYRKINTRTGDFLSGGRFVKRGRSNFSTTHAAKAYTHTQPPRPFFRNMVAENKGGWGGQIGILLKRTDYDPAAALEQMGFEIEGQLQDSIKKLTSPPLARSTIRAKGFAKPLIGGARDSGGGGLMWQSTGHEVTHGT